MADAKFTDVSSVPQVDGTDVFPIAKNGSTVKYNASAAQLLTYIEANATFSATPGGSDTEIQFNNAGAFDGSPNFTYDGTTVNIQVTGADIPLTLTRDGNPNDFIRANTLGANNIGWDFSTGGGVGESGFVGVGNGGSVNGVRLSINNSQGEGLTLEKGTGNAFFSQDVTIEGNTASTVPGTGALIVAGGASVGDTIYSANGYHNLALPYTLIDTFVGNAASVSPTKGTVLIDTSSATGNVTITIKDSAADNDGDTLRIILIDNTHDAIIDTVSSQNIGGLSSQTISQVNKGISLASRFSSTEWLKVQDSRFLEGTVEGELQYWDNTDKAWKGTGTAALFDSSVGHIVLETGNLYFGGDGNSTATEDQKAVLTQDGSDGIFNVIDDSGNKLIQFGSAAYNLHNTGGANATDYDILFRDSSGLGGGGSSRGEAQGGDITAAIRPSDGAAFFGNTTSSRNYTSNAVHVQFNTASTSPSNGALIVDGGAGINGDVNVGGDLSFGSVSLSSGENADVDTGTENVDTFPTSDGNVAKWVVSINDGTNFRASEVVANWDGTNVEHYETSTNDIGDTTGVTLDVDISGGNVRLRATTTTDNWAIKFSRHVI